MLLKKFPMGWSSNYDQKLYSKKWYSDLKKDPVRFARRQESIKAKKCIKASKDSARQRRYNEIVFELVKYNPKIMRRQIYKASELKMILK